jgi:hypothetical protein
MKIAASLVALALIGSPALGQDQKSVKTTHVQTTTRHIHATNVPVHHRVARHRRHHVVHCNRVTRHGKTYCARTHHVVVKKTETTTKS